MMKNLPSQPNNRRRHFLRQGSLLVAGASVIGLGSLATSCNNNREPAGDDAEENVENDSGVSANEDLMREHGLLQRMLLIYDAAIARLNSGGDFDPAHINQTANIIKSFIEEYHEKLEEAYVFPALTNAGKLTDLVKVLTRQHANGRQVTREIIAATNNGNMPSGDDLNRLTFNMQRFNTMYRPHEAREDTVVFPAFKASVSPDEYRNLGEKFEEVEQQHFGNGGFDAMVDKVAGIEKQVGIYNLSQFTPQV